MMESKSNPYIGYFLLHDGTYSPKRTARYMRPPPVLKTMSSQSTAAPSRTDARSVRFSDTVRKSSLVATHWDGELCTDPFLSMDRQG